jgi:hypothetical protein
VHRIVIGRATTHIVSLMFGLKLRDVDCDFRLIGGRSSSGSILERRAASSASR